MTLSKQDLNKHLFVCGLTGSGKTTTVKGILKKLADDNVPFLVLESAKRDYRQLLADSSFSDMNVFTIGDARVSPIQFNPFYVQKEVSPLVHIDFLKAIFNASFSLYGPMPHILEKCLYRIYQHKGWNLTTGEHPYFLDTDGYLDESKYEQPEHFYFFPTLTDLKQEVERYINQELDYKGELRDNIKTAILTRLESLCVGAKGLMFNTHEFYSIKSLLETPTIFEMESLADDDDKAFFVGLILVLISEYRQADNPTLNPGQQEVGLKHFLVIEEAHRLLKNVSTERNTEMMGNPKGKAVEVFCNVIAEMRSLGQGVAVVEQIPSKISPDVIKNTNMKIVHRLVSKDDQSLLASSLGIEDNEALYLNRLKTGFALCHKEGMERPVEISVVRNFDSAACSDARIHRAMREKNPKENVYQVYEFAELLGSYGLKICTQWLHTFCISDEQHIKALFDKAASEVLKQLKLRDYRWPISEEAIRYYMRDMIVGLFIRGTYSQQAVLPSGFINNIERLFAEPNIDNARAFKQILRDIWRVESENEHIMTIIANLAMKAKRKKQETKGLAQPQELAKEIRGFFLGVQDSAIDEAVQRIVNSVHKRGHYGA